MTRAHRQRREISTHAEAESGNWNEGFRVPDHDRAGSDDWRKRRSSVTLPIFARKAEHTFLLAAFLKILMLASVVPANRIFKPLGYTPKGIVAWLILLPLAALLAFLASSILRSDFMKRKGSGFAILLLSFVFIIAGGRLYGPSLPVRQPAAVSYSTPSRAQYEESLRQAAMSSPHLRTAEDSDRMWAADQPREEK